MNFYQKLQHSTSDLYCRDYSVMVLFVLWQLSYTLCKGVL